jgi:hypothetical protein
MTNQHLRRVLRPVGKVTPALKRHGYRQVAIILIDGKQVDNVCVLSIIYTVNDLQRLFNVETARHDDCFKENN